MTVLILLFLCFYLGLSIARPILALQVLILLLPSYLLRFTVSGIPFTVLEAMILLVTVVTTIRVLLHQQSLEPLRAFVLHHRGFMLLIAMFVVAGIIGVVAAGDTKAALGIFKAYLMEPLLLFGVWILCVRTSQDLRQLIYTAIAGGTVIALYGIVQWWNPALIPAPWNAEKLFRVTSFYEYPNAVGLIIGPLLILAIGMLVDGTSSVRTRIMLAISIVFMTLALMLSESQGAWAAVLVALFIGILYSRMRWMGIVMILVVGIALLIEPIRDRIVPILTFTDVSGEVRRVLWMGTFRLIQDHAIWGVGLSGFPAAYDFYREARHVELLQYPHNIVLNFWVEMGILGVISVIGLLIAATRSAISAIHQPEKIAALGMLIVVIVHGLVDVPFFKNDLAVLWWFVFFLAMCSIKTTKSSDDR